MKITVGSYFDKIMIAMAKRLVSISTSEPKHIQTDAKIVELVPGWDLVMGHKNGETTDAEYTARYLTKIEPDLDAAIAQLKDGDLLLCWCKRDAFCHRIIVATQLQARGIEVEVR